MTCASCVGRVERALPKTPGVRRGAGEPRDREGDRHLRARAGRPRGPRRRGPGRGLRRASRRRRPAAAATGAAAEDAAGVADVRGGARRRAGRPRRHLPRPQAQGHRRLRAQHDHLPRARCSRTGSPSCPHWLHNGYVLWALATPVQFWVGWQFYTAPGPACGTAQHEHEHADRHGLLGGLPLQRRRRALPGVRSSTPASASPMYFDSAAVIITLILLGRLLEARAKGQTGEAIRKLIGLQPRTARVVRDGGEVDVPDRRRRRRRPRARAPRREGPGRRRRRRGQLGGRRVDAHRRADPAAQGEPATRSSARRSTRPARSPSAPRGSAATRRSRRSSAWSSRRRARSRRSSGWPT